MPVLVDNAGKRIRTIRSGETMTLTIELTPEEEAGPQAQAHAAGLEASEYARQSLASDLAELPLPKTGAEAVAFRRRAGVFGLFADRGDAQQYTRHLREREQSRGADLEIPETDAAWTA